MDIRYCFSALFLSLSFNVSAAYFQDVTVKNLHFNRVHGNHLFIRLSAPPSIAGCQTDNNWNFVLALDAPVADKMYAALLSAQASQAKVTVAGSGACYVGIEYLATVTVIK